MKIKRLVIENFKSIERVELIEPNPFTVFVGPNGSGKSNIFEALEFVNLKTKLIDAESLFGGSEVFLNRNLKSHPFLYLNEVDEYWSKFSSVYYNQNNPSPYPKINKDDFTEERIADWEIDDFPLSDDFEDHFSSNESKKYWLAFYDSFSRLFIGKEKLLRIKYDDSRRLNIAGTNLERVLKRVLSNYILKNEIFEWLELFIPEFKNIDVVTNQFDGKETLLWYEQYSEKPFTKNLISDGTYNILALLTAVYQSDDKPQFLCIEEPENGLHPQVAGELVDFFRTMCEERGHYIWLNTHSQTMASRLRPEEMVVVEKKQGSTRIKQFKEGDLKGWRMDEAWLTNALGGGLPW